MNKTKVVIVRLSRKEMTALATLARKHADGNLSAWLREAGLNFRRRRAPALKKR